MAGRNAAMSLASLACGAGILYQFSFYVPEGQAAVLFSKRCGMEQFSYFPGYHIKVPGNTEEPVFFNTMSRIYHHTVKCPIVDKVSQKPDPTKPIPDTYYDNKKLHRNIHIKASYKINIHMLPELYLQYGDDTHFPDLILPATLDRCVTLAMSRVSMEELVKEVNDNKERQTPEKVLKDHLTDVCFEVSKKLPVTLDGVFLKSIDGLDTY
eukprot:Tbor_TRINITY_DN5625_c3_g1::TRINITY_DN5625_c3_g1_i1::g.8113::m.8113